MAYGRKTHGILMEDPWTNIGSSMVVPWETYGNHMGAIQTHGSPVGD